MYYFPKNIYQVETLGIICHCKSRGITIHNLTMRKKCTRLKILWKDIAKILMILYTTYIYRRRLKQIVYT